MMRSRIAEFLRSRQLPLQGIAGRFLLLALGYVGWAVACGSTTADAPSTYSQPYTFYLDSWSEEEGEQRLVPLDSETLDEQPDGKTLPVGIVSADGSTGVNMEFPEGRASLSPEAIWIVVYDLQSGDERNRFHPPAKGFVYGLSGDGTRLLLNSESHPPAQYPPPAEWYVVDTASGEPTAHIEDVDQACFRQRALLDPAGQRIYCVEDPALLGADEPVPMRIVAYDIEQGRRKGELELPQALIGGSMTELDGRPVAEFLEPAVELSPDGQRLAIVHADTDKVTLINAHNLTVEKSFTLNRRASFWDWLTPAVAHAKGPMLGTIRQASFSYSGQHLYIFSQEVTVRPEDAPAERGLWLVDLEKESLMAEALPDYQIQWLHSAPDGTAYVFGTTDRDLLPYEIRTNSPSKLWRLDGLTLEITAERAFTGYRQGRLVKAAAVTASSEVASANGKPASSQ